MKTKIYLLLVLAVLVTASVGTAQNVIALQHGNTNTIFTNFDSAMAYAVNGDYIYLPGGTIYGNMNINKDVHIIGAGHYPDSTTATYKTTVVGSCNINSGADNGSIEGISFTIDIQFNGIVSNYNISRCRFQSMYLSNTTYELTVTHCVIMSAIFGNSAQNILFENNIIENVVWYFSNNAAFYNNIFTYYAFSNYRFILQVTGVLFENNIISVSSGNFQDGSSHSNIYNNNIFESPIDLGLEQQQNNQFNVLPSSILVNVNATPFSYSQDYHLAAGSPAIGAGTNGTDIGIYGGTYPWKEGSVPMNPHIQTKTIGTTTNQNGDLPVNIQVGAQDH